MKPFKFKQFAVEHDRCAMKVGTDGVLLGAWSDLSHCPQSILDVGSGSGIVALMLAQRSAAQIVDAVEIETEAYEQCVDNFENSTWGDRLFCYHASFQEFVEEMMDEEYDLIVSNPPFFEGTESEMETARELARFTFELPFQSLLHGVSTLLSDRGKFCVVVPYDREREFLNEAQEVNLCLEKITRVKGTTDSTFKRSLIQLSKGVNKKYKEEVLVLEIERHVYTPEYIELVKDFYLKL